MALAAYRSQCADRSTNTSESQGQRSLAVTECTKNVRMTKNWLLKGPTNQQMHAVRTGLRFCPGPATPKPTRRNFFINCNFPFCDWLRHLVSTNTLQPPVAAHCLPTRTQSISHTHTDTDTDKDITMADKLQAGANADTPGMPYYEKSRQTLKELLQKRKTLERQLVSCASQARMDHVERGENAC